MLVSISMATTFDLIKKQNGEAFAKAIRSYDEGIFDIPNITDIVQYAGREAGPIMNFLASFKKVTAQEYGVYKPVEELLSDAGYNAYYADTLEKQNAIAPYFARGEELCTFKDNARYQKYYIINAVRKNVDKIKRKDFPTPKREDLYGTSVISIQVLKTGGFISIKNRYNHSVENPDNTFSSNPDLIIRGLGEAIKHRFNVDFTSKSACLPLNYTFQKNKIFKYHREAQNIYFGNGFWIEDGKLSKINPDHQILCDSIVLDLKKKEFFSPIADKTVDVLNNEIKGKRLSVKTDKLTKNKKIYLDNELFMEVKKDCSQIISLNIETTKLPNLSFEHTYLKSLTAPNLTKIGTCCFQGGLEHIHTTKKVIVNGDIDFYRKNLTELPDFSNFIVKGSFYCAFNKLTSLKGCPKIVHKDFICNFTHLTDLTGAPEYVGRNFDCSHNRLVSLKGCPPVINGSFYCNHNQLQTYEYFPKTNLSHACTEGNPAGRYGPWLRKKNGYPPIPDKDIALPIQKLPTSHPKKNTFSFLSSLFSKKKER